jgi:TRAP-type C4-dicarboxylate transport system permease small subunit
MRLLRVCEALAAVAIGTGVLIVTAVATSRYIFGYTPVWTEPVVALLIFFAICAALPPGLQEGVHVSIHLLDALKGRRLLFWRHIVIWTLCLALALVMAVSAVVYTLGVGQIGLKDYAGIPQSYQGVLACLFGIVLALYSLATLAGLIRGKSR